MSKKNKKWCHLRHQIWVQFAKIFMFPILKIKAGMKYKKFQVGENKNRNFLILYNHQTVYDQFLVGYLFNNKTYHVATDDLASIPIIGKFLEHAVHFIPYKKASTDFSILRNCRQVASEGGNISIAPEGNRTYSGKTGYINPTISKMVKFLKLPVAFVSIVDGFGVMPRFADKPRKGNIKIYVCKVLEYDEYKDMSNEELTDIINKTLYHDESVASGAFKSRKKAEYIERALYLCPDCGNKHLVSNGNYLNCPKCGLKLEYQENKQFKLINGKNNLKNVSKWYDYQLDVLKKTNLLSLDSNKPIFRDKTKFYEVVPRKFKKVIADDAVVTLYNNRLEVKYYDIVDKILFDDINSSGVFGKNKFNVYLDDATYQFKSFKGFNALKYVQYYYKYKLEKGENDDEFFGI